MPGVTKEQIQAAREADLFTYLQFHEPGVLKRDGPNFRHKEHDSLVYVTGKRYWYWNSRGRSINALDYLIQIRGYGLVDAVHALVGGEIRHTPAYRSTAEIQVSKEPEKKSFIRKDKKSREQKKSNKRSQWDFRKLKRTKNRIGKERYKSNGQHSMTAGVNE